MSVMNVSMYVSVFVGVCVCVCEFMTIQYFTICILPKKEKTKILFSILIYVIFPTRCMSALYQSGQTSARFVDFVRS